MVRMPEEGLEHLDGRKKLSFQEKKVMDLIWDKGNKAMSDELYTAIPLARGTVSAILSHIAEKGYVEIQRKGRNYLYIATTTKLEYEQAIMHQKIKKYLGVDSIVSLVGMFCGKTELCKKEQEEIELLIQRLERDE